MPYRRRLRRRAPARKGKKLGYRQKKQVKLIINKSRELKFHAYTALGQAISSTGTLTGLPCDVPQGDTDTTRDGDSYDLAGNIQFKFQLLASDTTNLVRLVWFQWKDISTAAGPSPAASDILFPGPSGAVDVCPSTTTTIASLIRSYSIAPTILSATVLPGLSRVLPLPRSIVRPQYLLRKRAAKFS